LKVGLAHRNYEGGFRCGGGQIWACPFEKLNSAIMKKNQRLVYHFSLSSEKPRPACHHRGQRVAGRDYLWVSLPREIRFENRVLDVLEIL
jgi:hypothetical protein